MNGEPCIEVQAESLAAIGGDRIFLLTDAEEIRTITSFDCWIIPIGERSTPLRRGGITLLSARGTSMIRSPGIGCYPFCQAFCGCIPFAEINALERIELVWPASFALIVLLKIARLGN
ncbi:hypothetical protein [Candidatus Pristimantibacillus sp. PTI5]|uniref:hypothetical protein n=1 Tax=Candidatus Pristimantibacillus sp. PTI5 TaxID=3400422 RepID=UPI003B014F36